MSVNKVIIVGNLGADPESIAGGDGCRLSIATNERWTDKQGQKQERTEWHRCVCWGATAENCQKYLTKGRQVYVEGSIQTNEWTDNDGVDRTSKEIRVFNVTFLSGETSGGGGGRRRKKKKKKRRSGGSRRSNSSPFASGGASTSYDDDDVPF